MDGGTYSLQKTYTEANTDKKFCVVKECVDSLCAKARNKSVNLIDGNIELVVQVDAGAEKSCKYYFVDHEARTLFWLVDLDEEIEDIFSAIQVYDLTHMGASCRTHDAADMNHQ
jgi:hypothetical protein